MHDKCKWKGKIQIVLIMLCSESHIPMKYFTVTFAHRNVCIHVLWLSLEEDQEFGQLSVTYVMPMSSMYCGVFLTENIHSQSSSPVGYTYIERDT